MPNITQYNLINSPRWIGFLESAARSLQLNIALIVEDAPNTQLQIPRICPACKRKFNPLSDVDIAIAASFDRNYSEGWDFITTFGETAVFLPLQDLQYIIVRDCSCILNKDLPTLRERASLARKLLTNFLIAFYEGIQGGQSSLELSTLRQINQIMLSLFRGESDISEQTFDLILSALIILLDAEGSWLEYNEGSCKQRIIKGNREIVERYLNSPQNADDLECNIVEIEGNTSEPFGRLGVLKPEDSIRSASLLPLMAQECSFVFEIEKLFHLLKNQLTRLLGAINSAVILINEQLQIAYLNKTAENLLEKPALPLIGRSVTVLPAFWSKHIEDQIDSSLSETNITFNRGDNAVILDYRILPLKDNDGIAGWLIIADDRTDFYHWQEVGKKAENFTAIASVIGPLAHELRNPLAATKGLLQLIQRRREPEKISGYVNLILREIDRMNILVNEFLQLGRSTKANYDLVDMTTILCELLPLLIGEASNNGVEILHRFEPAPLISADQKQITQVILNLVRNAVEAAGPVGTVEINLKSSEGWVILDFKNTGPGIPPEIMDKLFQPFVTTKEHGTGLGLAVSKAIITNHGGLISADNIPDYGALFSIKLPTATEKNSDPSLVDVLIGVADDMIRYPLEQVLQAAGFSTFILANISEAFEKKDLYQPRVLILDANLSTSDFKRVKQIWPKTKCLFTGEPINVEEFPNLQYLPKPINYARLIEAIRSLIKSLYNKA